MKSCITGQRSAVINKNMPKNHFYENAYISKRTVYPIYSKVFCDLRALIEKDITIIVIKF